MSTKPTKLPRWGTTAGRRLEPPENGTTTATKDNGWEEGKRLPVRIMNWLQGITYEWCSYLDDLENQALTWAAVETFTAGIIATNGTTATVNATAPGPLIDAIRGTGSGAGTGIRGSSGAGGIGILGIGPSGGIGVRGSSSGSVGVRGDDSGGGVGIYALNDGSGYAFYATKTGAPGTPNDTVKMDGFGSNAGTGLAVLALEQLFVNPSGWVNREPALRIDQGTIYFAGGQPTVSQDPGYANVLHAGLICKAWGNVSIGGGVATINDGNNFASATISGSAVVITFVRGMANATYTVTYGVEIGDLEVVGSGYLPQPFTDTTGAGAKTTTSFKIKLWSGSAIIDPAGASGLKVHFEVMARQ